MILPAPATFSDHLVFVDESGDHGLVRIDRGYPIFVLAFCLFSISDYVERVGPALQRLKFRFWGHDEEVLHEHEIRKPNKNYGFLFDAAQRTAFLDAVSKLVPVRLAKKMPSTTQTVNAAIPIQWGIEEQMRES